MLLNSWSITLAITTIAAVFLAGGAGHTAVRILRFWDSDADTAAQIKLESETWLSASLMELGMVLQSLGLLLLVLAADSYSEILVGAMCATGAFLANPYGIPLLLVRIFGLFFYGFWIVLHRLDISSENFPLIRIKSWYLLFLLPLLLTDSVLLVLYLSQLQPDIITSCCGVVFGSANGDGKNLIGPLPVRLVMLSFYGLAGLLAIHAVVELRQAKEIALSGSRKAALFFSMLWVFFFSLSLLVITAVISSYIYGMPFHRCPFDILKKEYFYIGYPLYFTLFSATFFGMSGGLTALFKAIEGVEQPLRSYHRVAFQLCLLLLFCFLAVVSWYPLLYLYRGGAP